MTYPQVAMYLAKLPMIAYRTTGYPLAKVMSLMGNMMGGKRKANDQQREGDFEAFTAEDFIPWFARYGPYILEQGRGTIEPEAARAFLRASVDGALPSWVLNLVTLPEIQRAANA